jgi:hypothetical protein
MKTSLNLKTGMITSNMSNLVELNGKVLIQGWSYSFGTLGTSDINYFSVSVE